MKYRIQITNIEARATAMFLSFVLMFSFGLHAVETQHEHYSPHASGTHEHQDGNEVQIVALGEYLHGAEKKILAMLVLVSISVWMFLYLPREHLLRLLLYMQVRVASTEKIFLRDRLPNYLQEYLRLGIMHSKAY